MYQTINEALTKTDKNIRFFMHKTDLGEAYLTASVAKRTETGQAARECYRRISAALAESGMSIVHERIFGSMSSYREVMEARAAAMSLSGISPEGPVTYVQGSPVWGPGLAGVTVQAVPSGTQVWAVMDGGIQCGRGWKSGELTSIVLQDINGLQSYWEDPDAPPARQAENMINRAERILRSNGASFRNVARTWFYLYDILSWYGEFNRVRSARYGELGIMPASVDDDMLLLPASTGVGASNPSGSAGVLDLLAVIGPLGSRVDVGRVSNPRQMDAYRYNAAFARGTVMRNGSGKTVHVSGTAAIDERGCSVHEGEAACQMECTFENVGTLLKQAGASFEDIAYATAFVKVPEAAALFYETLDTLGLSELPCICVVADICRSELLFELDAVAVVG